ncbi:Yip1 family protein [Halomonas sp. AOP12-C2-37]|uniref:YIP1 family protein n=1 Tax=Halomonas casei TaxID=2742613 RepID=A0ABR9F4S0_9GAMM|nr:MULTISPECIES: Yip1 family protein [Halomonas]MBE0401468.1 YIP1 family protein [Halomonas casei]PCC22270.1 YIP1 family protein [Halomonas sp. JB37]
MIHHVWGLLHHPEREWHKISGEHETVTHLYAHHVLLLAAIPVICALIGTTQVGWTYGGSDTYKVSLSNGIALGVAFYALILLAVGIVGSVIYWMARDIEQRPSRRDCLIFAGYIATPMFICGVFALYPVFWLCMLGMVIGLVYSGYLLYRGTPSFLGISHQRGFILSIKTLGIGVLVLEALLVVTVLLWSMGTEHSVVWEFFR